MGLATHGPAWLPSVDYQTMRDRAHRRSLQALKMLAAVRKLGPAIPINVARQQVNVAG